MTKFYVVCDDYVVGPHRTQLDAEQARARIERSGHCKLEHRIEERER
jgi:hypothetical protein